MKEEEFRKLCGQRGLDEQQTNAAVHVVHGFGSFVGVHGQTWESATVDSLKEYIAKLVEIGENSFLSVLSLGRYAFLSGNNDLYLYVLSIIGVHTVIPSLLARTAEIAGDSVRDAVARNLTLPPVGSPQSCFPAVTQKFVEELTSRLPLETSKDILAGNHHKLPTEAFKELRRIYLESGIDAVLRYRQVTLLAELEEHAISGTPWYEQTITPEVVEFVRNNPEIQAGVREGDAIYVTKIPFDPVAYLHESDPKKKCFHMCHCALARTSILDESTKVSPVFCHCSGGYEKFPFDVAFGTSTKVTVLKNALAGDPTCRFRIDIPEGC